MLQVKSLQVSIPQPDTSLEPSLVVRRPRSARISREALASPYGVAVMMPVMTPATTAAAQMQSLFPFPLRRTRSGGVMSPRPGESTGSHAAGLPMPMSSPKVDPRHASVSKAPPTLDLPAAPIGKAARRLQKEKKEATRPRKRAAVEGATVKLPMAPALGLSVAVPKQRQEASWDCGLACTQMVLLSLGCPPEECSLTLLRTRLISSEVWSVDLAYLLTEYGEMRHHRTTPRERSTQPKHRTSGAQLSPHLGTAS